MSSLPYKMRPISSDLLDCAMRSGLWRRGALTSSILAIGPSP